MKRNWLRRREGAKGFSPRKPWTKAVARRRDQGQEEEYDTDLCDKVFSGIVRELAGWRCVGCGKSFERNPEALHCSHFIGRGVYVVRYDLRNADALCKTCHLHPIDGWEFHKRTVYKVFMEKKLGSAGLVALRLTARAGGKLSEAKATFMRKWEGGDFVDSRVGSW